MLSPVKYSLGLIFVAKIIGCTVQPHPVSTELPTSYAALGDSYASGDGAGSSRLLPRFDATCGRFSDAYPIQVANSTSLAIETSSFRNLACGGGSTSSVLRSQVPWIGDSQIVTLTVGGNEVDFFVLLNECVQQWRPFSTCEAEMQKSREMVESSQFITNYGKLIHGLMTRLKREQRLLVTGYARFFNAETDQCNHVSFSRTNAQNLLTNGLRRRFNELVELLNDVIRAVTVANGADYVDIDRIFEGHRFCEENVTEPDAGRDETWFFSLKYMSQANRSSQKDNNQQSFPNPIKDFSDLTRVFHPTGRGHTEIAKEIVKHVLGE